MSLQELVTSISQSQTQFQQETKNTFSNIQEQIGDLATAFNKMEQRGKLPSQTEKNPNVSEIILRSWKTLGSSNPKRVSREEDDEVIVVEPSRVVVPPKELAVTNIEQLESSNKTIKPLVQINLPLLNVIKQIPSYVKFLKDLCTKRRKIKENEKIQVNANVSVILEARSVMPYSVFQSLNVGPLEETEVIIQLADKSNFYVIDLEEKAPSKSSMTIIGRTFMNNAQTIVDVHKGKLTMEFDGEIIHFNVIEAMRYPSNISPLYRVDVIQPINGISLKVCTHKILMEDYCKDKREAQRRLNPLMTEVVKKKIIKRFKRCKEKKKAFHDKHITQKHFIPGQKVLYYSRLKLFLGKLRSRWHRPFIALKMFDLGAVGLKSLETNQIFKVNGHRLKPFYKSFDSGEFDNVTFETLI
ncbi:uncharacterized protein LOC111898245 [Lactuca sativa]|uniref:uncharacterized protein LOC111898245 n=1 Tax=Lactuca sativa TaxID=4236 RepID=UPI0022AF45B7|nr:uncharacterized protein LOC111898245 [Lactuca sativa]